MKNELRIFFTALMFYTRIPCPAWVDHSEDYLNKASRYFPLMGWLVGLAMTLVLCASLFIFPVSVSVLLALAVSVLMTGAFHEDGFGDVCDGFGGGWTKSKILEIMKDSQVGTYAVVGLIVLFALKIAALISLLELDQWFALKSLVLAHVLSRWSALTVIYTHSYSREDASSKIKPIAKELTLKNVLIGSVWVLPALVLFNSWWIVAVFVPVYGMKGYLAAYFQKWIDGYTGDCLGATQQINEVVILIFCLGVWKFI
jgi:adenosylcobinamide-GDP ribazoletransferase